MPLQPTPPADLNLPTRSGPVRFAVGAPDDLTSNSWRFWTTAAGDAYLACRDNFNNMKVSLHASGRWRMAYTSEALALNPALVAAGSDRAWEVWDEPPAVLPEIVAAFRLIFLTSELAVRPEQRATRQWRNTVFIEAAPAGTGKLTVVTLFVTRGEPEIVHASEPSFCLASLRLREGRRAQLVAHADLEGDMPRVISSVRASAAARAQALGIDVTVEAFLYAFGSQPEDGARFIIGARARP